jgi:hypothetical protein
MKSMNLFSAIALACLTSIACARTSFNLFLGPQPCYYPVMPMPVIPAPMPAPSVGFSVGIPLGDPCDGAPTLGFSVSAPLFEPVVPVIPVVRTRPVVVHRPVAVHHYEEPVYVETVCRDDEDRSYWRIYNNTNASIKVMSNSATKTIEPGQSCKLDHSTSFSLRITDGDQKIKLKTTHHALNVQCNRDGDLKVSRA